MWFSEWEGRVSISTYKYIHWVLCMYDFVCLVQGI